MEKDYSNKDLQNASLTNEDFSHANFSGSDLRGADLSGSNFTGADFSNARTGIATPNVVFLFIGALAVSLLSGYVAAQVGRVIREMLGDPEQKVRIAGIITIVLLILYIAYALWKGGHNAMRNLVIPTIIVALLVAIIARISGLGTGKGMLYQIFALVLTVAMVYVGTVSRAVAGNLSNILFTIVALAGGMFGKSIAGGIGPVILAIFCALISKRALANAKGFEALRKVVALVTKKYGTSFRNTKLSNTNFSQAKLHNADFTNADITSVTWEDANKFNCINGTVIITNKKKKKHE
jgi:uncharacterized protein YjbI with pentapeptide repeats